MSPVEYKGRIFLTEEKHVPRLEGRASGTGVGKDKWNVSEHRVATRNRLKSRIMKGHPSHAEEFRFYPAAEAVNH